MPFCQCVFLTKKKKEETVAKWRECFVAKRNKKRERERECRKVFGRRCVLGDISEKFVTSGNDVSRFTSESEVKSPSVRGEQRILHEE